VKGRHVPTEWTKVKMVVGSKAIAERHYPWYTTGREKEKRRHYSWYTTGSEENDTPQCSTPRTENEREGKKNGGMYS